MEEEISLREIIEKLWQGKWIIVGIAVIALLISGIYSFLIADPVYKGDAKVTVHNVTSVPEEVQPYINELTNPVIFEQTLKSTTVLGKVIEQESLDTTIGKLQGKFNVELPSEDTNSFISISMEGTDRDEIKSIIDTAITVTRQEIGAKIQSRLELLEEEYLLKMEEENENIDVAVKEFNDIRAGEGLPTLLLFQQNAADSQYMLEANEELLNELKNLDKTDQIKYEKINQKIEKLTSLYTSYSNKYDDVRSSRSMNIIDISTNVLADTFVPDSPVSPNKMLNIAISIVLGLMVGVFIVFIREYMRDTSK